MMPKAPKSRTLTCRECLYPKPHRNPDVEKYEVRTPARLEFPTPDKLDNHLKTKHRSAMYECNAIGCFKGASITKFQKPETLTQHIKDSHRPDSMFSCPIKTCNFGPSRLPEMIVHAHWAHSGDPTALKFTYRHDHIGWTHDISHIQQAVRAMMNAAPWLYSVCPVWNCRKSLMAGSKSLSVHLLEHSVEQLEEIREQLNGYSYEMRILSSTTTDDTVSHEISICIRCPACKQQCENDESFRGHLESNHLVAPGMIGHIETWKRDLQPFVYQGNAERFSRHPCWLQPTKYLQSKAERAKCSFPECSHTLKKPDDQHLGFLRAANAIKADLAPYCMEVLRHYPEFLTCHLLRTPNPQGAQT